MPYTQTLVLDFLLANILSIVLGGSEYIHKMKSQLLLPTNEYISFSN